MTFRMLTPETFHFLEEVQNDEHPNSVELRILSEHELDCILRLRYVEKREQAGVVSFFITPLGEECLLLKDELLAS